MFSASDKYPCNQRAMLPRLDRIVDFLLCFLKEFLYIIFVCAAEPTPSLVNVAADVIFINHSLSLPGV